MQSSLEPAREATMAQPEDIALDVKSESGTSQVQDAPQAASSSPPKSASSGESLHERISSEFDSSCGRFEYCGEIAKHEIHWTEWVFFLTVVTSGICLIVLLGGKSIPPEVFNVLMAFVSIIAASFLWGYARIKTLAGLARTLKSLVAEAKQNTRKHQENNRTLAEENEKIVHSLVEFKNSVGLVDSAVKDIDEVENKLNTLLKRHQALVDEQKKFDEEHKAFLDIQEKNRLWLKQEQSKARVRDQFSYADINRDGTVATPKEKEKLKEYVEKAGFQWTEGFDKDGDGGIRLWELMAELDKQTKSEFSFSRITHVEDEVKTLRSQLQPLKELLERVLKERGDWKDPALQKQPSALNVSPTAASPKAAAAGVQAQSSSANLQHQGTSAKLEQKSNAR